MKIQIKVDSRDLKLCVITEFDVLIVKVQFSMTIDHRGLPCKKGQDNYYLSSVTVRTSLIANFIYGRSLTGRN